MVAGRDPMDSGEAGGRNYLREELPSRNNPDVPVNVLVRALLPAPRLHHDRRRGTRLRALDPFRCPPPDDTREH